MKKLALVSVISVALLSGCASVESHNAVAVETVSTHQVAYHGVKSAIAVGQFNNSSNYHQGVFSSGKDELGTRSKTILVTHLQQTGRFTVLDRRNMKEIASEANISGKQQALKGATYVITGDVTEFGRKTVGQHSWFHQGKKQVAYAKVALNVVNVHTSQIVYSAQGAGEYALTSQDVLGFGSSTGFDSTLTDKVLGFAIKEAVEKLVSGIESGHWSPQE